MYDHRVHKYSQLLAYIEHGCKRMKEERDYKGFLLSIERAVSLRELISIYNEVFKFLAVSILGNYKLPNEWYNTVSLGIGNSWLFHDLSEYFNDNVLRVFRAYKNPPIQYCKYCLANLREGSNSYLVQDEIIKTIRNDDVKEIISARARQYNLRKEIESYGSSHRMNYLDQYIGASAVLAHYSRHFDIAETLFGQKYGIKYEELTERYERDLKEAEEKKKEQMRKLAMEKDRDVKRLDYTQSYNALDEVGSIFGSALLSIPFAIIGALLGSIKKK